MPLQIYYYTIWFFVIVGLNPNTLPLSYISNPLPPSHTQYASVYVDVLIKTFSFMYIMYFGHICTYPITLWSHAFPLNTFLNSLLQPCVCFLRSNKFISIVYRNMSTLSEDTYTQGSLSPSLTINFVIRIPRRDKELFIFWQSLTVWTNT